NCSDLAFALAVDLGQVQSTTSPVTWAVGLVRDPTVVYTTVSDVVQKRRPYYVTQYADISSADFVLGIGQQRVSPVENMFAAWPAYLYLNSTLCGAMLAPLLESQDTSPGPQFSASDLGPGYPNATGPTLNPSTGVEHSGNMLILMQTHARISGDGTLLARHYALARRWADYLVGNALTPQNQQTANTETTANMTNLALKGIISVKAMAEISRVVGNEIDAQEYDLLYSLYADHLLGTDLVSSSVLDDQTQFYGAILSSAGTPLGLPIDSESQVSGLSSTAWTMLTAATVTNTSIRDQLIDKPEVDVVAIDSTAVGSMFAPLALLLLNQTISTQATAPSVSSGSRAQAASNRAGLIAGCTIAGLVVAALVVFLLWRWTHRKHRTSGDRVHMAENTHHFAVIPYGYESTTLDESSNSPADSGLSP
ncbi:hypothetical protein K466DRAFT_570980, partial [Polyporus arcularius HHB13444]